MVDTTKLSHPSEFEALCKDACARVREISVDEVEALLASGEDCCLIDVRDKEEFESYHIDGAQFISKGWIEAKIHTIVPDKNKKVILYCGGGNRSVLAADNVQKMGYSNILSMKGGIKAWVNAGKKIVEK